MTCQQVEESVQDFLDAEIELSGEMRAHLDGCAVCRALVSDLRAIRAEASALPALEPRSDLWSGIAARIAAPVVPIADRARSGPAVRHISWRWAGVAAAALVVASATVTYQMTRRGDTGTTPIVAMPGQNVSTVDESPAPARVVLAMSAAAKVDYDREIMVLRAVLDSGRSRLDPATVALLERNLRLIDTAIVQCRDAIAKDPASTFLIQSLNNAYDTKVKLLRIAAAASRG